MKDLATVLTCLRAYYDTVDFFDDEQVMSIRGKGNAGQNGGPAGDQLVQLTVEVPKNLSNEQKKALRAFEDTVNDKNYQKRQSFHDKLKKAFGGE